MSILVLSHADVEALLPMSEAIDLMADALTALAKGEVHNPLRFVIRPPDAPGLLGLMPAYRGGASAAWGLKTVCVYPSNPSRGLDAHQGAVLLHDAATGELRAVINASAVTAIRTAAVTGVATRLLARPSATRLAVLGAGVQARRHLEAMRIVRPLESVRLWSRNREKAEALASGFTEGAGLSIQVVDSAEHAVHDADIVVTITAAAEPVLQRSWLARGVHVNAVGSSIPTTREIDSATMAAASLFVDRRESTLNESGDYLFAARDGVIGPDHIRAELGEVLTGERPGRTRDDEMTLFKSLGLAVEDLAAAQFLDRRGRESGVGTVVPF